MMHLKVHVHTIAAILLLPLAVCILSSGAHAGSNGTSTSLAGKPEPPILGAEIWIYPGQTPAEIDGWFHQLAEAHMPVARLFLTWSLLEPAPGKWDFSLYDAAFRSAERYHIKVVTTLTPSGPPPFKWGDGSYTSHVLASEDQEHAAAVYIATVVDHYKNSAALDTWMVLNEPGQAPESLPLAVTEFRQWLAKRYSSLEALNKSWGAAYKSFEEVSPPKLAEMGFGEQNSQLDWLDFWRDYETEQLHWLERQVRAHDSNPAHGIHVNPPMLISNLAGLSEDLPSWRGFLDSLGCSIHPSWHFELLNRDQYALGVSYINDLVAGSIEPKPHWVTELQGGNNIYSGFKPIDPTSDDIAQWTWVSLGSGAKRVIYWLLNARPGGIEAAEWSMTDFQGRPSSRLDAASSIANVMEQNRDFFTTARPVESPITVMLSLETFTLEERSHRSDYPGRDVNAHQLEVLGMYQAVSQLGVPPRVKFFKDYDWDANTKFRRTVILPDVRAITEAQVDELEKFVAHGNTLIITGLTGFYDPRAKAWPLAGFPLGRVTGGDLKEIHFAGDRIPVPLSSPPTTLPSHLWISTIDNHTAQVIGQAHGETIATERSAKDGGRVIWIPSPIGLGAWLGETRPLAEYLRSVLAPTIQTEAFKFTNVESDCLMRVLHNGSSWVSIVANGGDKTVTCGVEHPAGLHGSPLWGQGTMTSDVDHLATFQLSPRGTAVTLWR